MNYVTKILSQCSFPIFISVDLAHSAIFRAKVGKGGINNFNLHHFHFSKQKLFCLIL